MRTKAEAMARKMLSQRICMNCASSICGLKNKKPVTKCTLTDKAVLPIIRGCFFWKAIHE